MSTIKINVVFQILSQFFTQGPQIIHLLSNQTMLHVYICFFPELTVYVYPSLVSGILDLDLDPVSKSIY